VKSRQQLQKIYKIGLAAALPLFLTALVFNYPLAFPGRYLPGADLYVLGYLMEAEFLAVASGIILILPLMVTTRSNWMKWFRRAIFLVSGFGFCWLAYNIAGKPGMLSYAFLVFVSFGGGSLFMFDQLSGVTRSFVSLLRWSAAIFLYVTFQLYFKLEIDFNVWKHTVQVIPFGASYFYTLVVLEVLVYPWLVYYLEKRLDEHHLIEQLSNQG